MIYWISIFPRWESVDQKIGRKEVANFINNIILELVYNSLGGSTFEHKIWVFVYMSSICTITAISNSISNSLFHWYFFWKSRRGWLSKVKTFTCGEVVKSKSKQCDTLKNQKYSSSYEIHALNQPHSAYPFL